MTTPESARRPSRFRRVRVAVAIGVILAGAAWTFRRPLFLWSLWVNGADKPEYYERIRSEQDPAIIARLVSGMGDAEKAFDVRTALASLLLEKNRVPEVEAALTGKDLEARAVALAALAGQKYFRKEYVDTSAFHVRETLAEWLASPKTRGHTAALRVLALVYPIERPPPEAVLATVRERVRSGASADLRVAAARTLAMYKDCAAGPVLLAAARAESDIEPRLRLMQSLEPLHDAADGVCRAQVPSEEFAALVTANLAWEGNENPPRALRMGAMLILTRHPEWMPPNLARVRAILASDANNAERRVALETLVAADDPATLEDLPRWFHDPSEPFRHTATQVGLGKKDFAWEAVAGCWIGLVRDEPASGDGTAFDQAMARLRETAGSWIGYPESLRRKGGALDPENRDRLRKLRATGRIEGKPGDVVTREEIAEAWFRWFAGKQGLDAKEDVNAAVAVRAAFWERARAGDVAGARAILRPARATAPFLWTYEWGWLLAHGEK